MSSLEKCCICVEDDITTAIIFKCCIENSDSEDPFLKKY